MRDMHVTESDLEHTLGHALCAINFVETVARMSLRSETPTLGQTAEETEEALILWARRLLKKESPTSIADAGRPPYEAVAIAAKRAADSMGAFHAATSVNLDDYNKPIKG